MDLQHEWARICREIEAAESTTAPVLDERFQQIIACAIFDFRQLQQPTTLEELKVRRMQRAALSGKIAALAHAAWVSKSAGSAAAVIIQEAEFLSQQQLPAGEGELPAFHHSLRNFVSRLNSLAS